MKPQLDRRNLFKRGAGAVAASVMTSNWPIVQLASAAESTDEYIDAHVHVWTDDLQQYPLAAGYSRESMQPSTFPPRVLFEHCRPVGVSRIVLIQMSYYGFDNRYILDAIRDHPGVFTGVAVVNPQHRDLAAHMTSLAARGVTGFRLHPEKSDQSFYEKWLRSEGLQSMFRLGRQTGQAMCFLVDPNALPQIDRMCRQFPDTTVVIDHMARIGMQGQIMQRDVDNLLRCARHKRVYVKVSAFYALGKKTPPYTDLGDLIRRLRDTYGAERLMWASDCPFQVAPGHSYRDSLELVKSRLEFLTPHDRNWMLRRTAEEVFFRE